MKIGIQGELGAYSHIAVENLYKKAKAKSKALESERLEKYTKFNKTRGNNKKQRDGIKKKNDNERN